MNWGNAYTKWLRNRGVDIAEIGILVRIASRIMAEVGDAEVEPHHVEEARAQAAAKGSSEEQLAIFDNLAAVYMEFQVALKSGALAEDAQGRENVGDRIGGDSQAPVDRRIEREVPEADGIDLEAAPKADSGIDLEAVPQADSGIDLEAVPQADSGIDLEAAPKADSGIDLEAVPQADSGIDLEAAPKADSGIELGAVPQQDSSSPSPPAESKPAAPAPVTQRACRHCGNAVKLDYAQKKLAISTGVLGVVAAGSGFLLGIIGSAAVFLIGVAIVLLVGFSLAAQRCEQCRRKIDEEKLHERETREIQNARMRLGAACAICAVGGVGMLSLALSVALDAGDPRNVLLETTVQSVAHRIQNDITILEMSRATDPALGNEAVIATFFGPEYTASAPSPPEDIGICRFPPERPFCVVVRAGVGDHEIIIEGYGEDRVTVIATETVEVTDR